MTSESPSPGDVYNTYKDGGALQERLLHISRSAVVRLDAELRFREITASIEQVIGYHADALIGKSYIDLLAPGYQEAFHNLVEKRDTAQLDYPLVDKDGIWQWVHHSGERISDDDTVSYAFIIQNVSQYKLPRDHVESERNLLRTIIDNLPAAIHATNSEGKYIFSNPAYAELVGKTRPAELLGQRNRDVLPSQVYERIKGQNEMVMSNGAVIITDEAFNQHWLNETKMPMRDAKGRITGVIGIGHDITQQKISQEKLANSEARQRVLLDALPDMMFVVKNDGTITELRSTPEVKSLGITDTVIGKHFSEAGLPKPLVDELQLYIDIALDSQYVQSFEFGGNHHEQTNTLSREEDQSEYYEARLVKLSDEEVMALVRNITPLKRIQDELSRHIEDLTIVRQVNAELAANLNLNFVSQLALDAALRLSNAQAGYLALIEPSGELVRKSVFGQYDLAKLDESLAHKAGIIGRILKTSEAELIFDVKQDPDYLPLLPETTAMIAAPLYANENNVGVLVLESRKAERFSHERFQFLQLITGRIAAFLENANLHRQTEDQLEELRLLYEEVRYLEQLKTDMIRIASHDLKNPIAGIMGYLEMLQLDVDDRLTEREQGYFEKIALAAKKMQRITTGILSLERIQQFSEEQSRERVNLKDLVYRSVSEQMDLAVRNEVTLNRDLPTEDVYIMADPLQMHEAISNLVNNAVKYTPGQGTVDVTLTVIDGRARVRIKDNGYGIPEQQQERLFAPFFRVKSPETQAIEGTGLGLHLVKNIIERHDGIMVFESEYGRGSTFGFDIPIHTNTRADATRPSQQDVEFD